MPAIVAVRPEPDGPPVERAREAGLRARVGRGIAVEGQGRVAAVADAILLGHAGGAIRGSVSRSGADLIAFRRFVPDDRNRRARLTARMACRVTFRLVDGAALGRRPPTGCPGVRSAPGRCRAHGRGRSQG